MMENKCNKTPNSNSKYLDHVYCHTSEGKNYIRANNNNAASGGGTGGAAATGVDFLALLKENKQLKAMLILHLELIQEQNDQLLGKDKQLANQSDELETLRTRNTQLDAQVQELQKQLQRQLKRAAAGERTSLPPPPLAKIQCKTEIPTTVTIAAAQVQKLPVGGSPMSTNVVATKHANIIGECNGKLISKIILHRVNMSGRGGTQSPHSTTTSDTTSEADDAVSKSQHDDDDEDDIDGEEEEAEDEELEDDEVEEEELGPDHTTTEEDSNDTNAHHAKRQRRPMPPLSLALPRGAKPRTPILITPPIAAPTSAPVQVCITPPTPSRGKQMPLMLWHAPEMHSESESASCDSLADTEQHSNAPISPTTGKSSTDSTAKTAQLKSHVAPPGHRNALRQARAKSRRCAFISTSQLYCTREWEDDEFICDYEFIKEEANALHADKPQLEIPKWTEHELSPSYCIEGTEDLCDETFLKRHAKFEVDEKRRKKWDVQQIREQRRIEKLKRRHCKDELQVPQEPQPLQSFYPQADAIQTIYFSNDLPVQAFGELIPKLGPNMDFTLPWFETTTPSTTTTTTSNSSIVTIPNNSGGIVAAGVSVSNLTNPQTQQQNSSFVFLKKRKRQQSSSAHTATTRQRSAATAAVTKTATTQSTPSNSTGNNNSASTESSK